MDDGVDSAKKLEMDWLEVSGTYGEKRALSKTMKILKSRKLERTL